MRNKPKSVNLFLGRWRNSAYSLVPSSLLWSCKTRGRRVTIPALGIQSKWKRREIKLTDTKSSEVLSLLPDPRGKKSFPTMLSNTEDLPELWRREQSDEGIEKADSTVQKNGRKRDYANLTTDNGDWWQRVPESRQCTLVAVVTESRASSLNLVH